MTSVLLRALPQPSARLRVLDFCCGSGVIGAALVSRQPTVRLTLLDADALATHAAAANLASPSVALAKPARILLSDAWAELPRRPRFDWIVSNPPVHLGLQTDFRLLRTLIAGASKRLRAGGTLYLVTQTYVPVGQLLAARGTTLLHAAAIADDGRFTVWVATRAPRGSSARARGAAATHGVAANVAPKRKRSSEVAGEDRAHPHGKRMRARQH